MNEIGVGIVGMGYMGLHHFKVLRQLQRNGMPVAVAGICDVNPQRLRDVSKKYPVGYTTESAEDLIRKDDVEAVYITTPWHGHPEIVRLATEYGKNIYCEKPIGSNSEEILELINIVKQAGVQAQAGFLLRVPVIRQDK